MKIGQSAWTWTAFALLLFSCHPAAGGDLHSDETFANMPSEAPADWSFSFTAYAWIPWISGDVSVKGRSFDVDISGGEVIDSLDWSGIPAWFSYAEARRGKLSFFSDVAYSSLSGSKDFARTGPLGILSLQGNVRADQQQAIVEVGTAYEIWSNHLNGGRKTALDALAGGRYWHQSATVSAEASIGDNIGLDFEKRLFVARSGSVDWIDPFIGARMRHEIAPGQTFTVRGDVGGFDVASELSWQVIATYDMQISITDSYAIDAYFGYRALSVDYSQGTGRNRYEFDAILQGPVVGATMRF